MVGKNFPKLNNEQASLLVKELKKRLGPELTDILDQSGINPNHLVRFQYIAGLCRNARQQRKISLKQASEKIKIPQYRLKDIEGGSIKTILPEFREKYVEFLGLTDAFCDWQKDNKDIYKSIQDNRGK